LIKFAQTCKYDRLGGLLGRVFAPSALKIGGSIRSGQVGSGGRLKN